MIPAVIERCAGIDVGKKFLVVCVITGPAKEKAKGEIRRFGRFGVNWSVYESGSRAKVVPTQ